MLEDDVSDVRKVQLRPGDRALDFRVAATRRKGFGVITHVPLKAGQRVFWEGPDTCREVPGSQASQFAVQIGEDTFWDPLDRDSPDNFINHSCDPNCYIDWSDMATKAIRDINAGEELTIDELTSAYDIETSGYAFDCRCGCKNCRGRISGFKYLSLPEKERIEKYLSPFLRGKLDAERSGNLA